MWEKIEFLHRRDVVEAKMSLIKLVVDVVVLLNDAKEVVHDHGKLRKVCSELDEAFTMLVKVNWTDFVGHYVVLKGALERLDDEYESVFGSPFMGRDRVQFYEALYIKISNHIKYAERLTELIES